MGLTVLVDARRCSPVPALFKAFSILQVRLELGQRNTTGLAVSVGCSISDCRVSPSASWLWEVESGTQHCLRRTSWACQAAAKAKKSRKSENTHPMWLPSLLRTVPKLKCSHELCMEKPREIGRDCCCRREGRRSSTAEGGEGHCLSGQVEEHMQLVMWLLLSDGNRTCCNSRLLQVKGFLSITGKTSGLCCPCSQITSGCCY